MIAKDELERIMSGMGDEPLTGGFLVSGLCPEYALLYASGPLLGALGYCDMDGLREALAGSCAALICEPDEADARCGQERCPLSLSSAREEVSRVPRSDGSSARVVRRVRRITLSSGEEAIFASYLFLRGCVRGGDAEYAPPANDPRQREAMLRALRAGEAASRAKAAFLSQMSRSLCSPVNAILELAESAAGELEDRETLAERLAGINLAGSFLLEIMEEMIEMSDIEGGRLRLAPDVYSYDMFSEHISDLARPLCAERRIAFKWINDTRGPDIYVDIDRFNSIFEHIFSNAIKYTPPGGSITFEIANRRIEDGALCCDYILSDTGPGMSPELQRRMFAPFECGASPDSREGTGLGLSITKQLVELMGGTISVSSELGHGTTVSIHLSAPLAEGAARRTAQDRAREWSQACLEADGRGARILVAESERLEREIMRRLLEKGNYEADCVPDGAAALSAFAESEEGTYSAILMDARMPGLDGFGAARSIRGLKRRDARSIPIVAMTTDAFGEDEGDAEGAGMNGCIVKPAEPGELFALLARLTRKSMFLPANMYKPT